MSSYYAVYTGNRGSILNITYEEVDGYHLFTSEDVEGLHVGSSDFDKAYADLPIAIEMLMRVNHGIACLVSVFPK